MRANWPCYNMLVTLENQALWTWFTKMSQNTMQQASKVPPILAGCGNAQGVTCLVMTGSSERDLS